MSFLSWIKREHGHSSMRELSAEIWHDETMAKVRNETGKEPPAMTVPTPGKGIDSAKKVAPKKARIRSRDIPF